MRPLDCPFCGSRPLEEFRFRKTLPEPGSAPIAAVYQRVDRLHDSVEHWQHAAGCRAWLWVRRNPSTDEVLEVRLLGYETGP
jgi:sarcosine oxidase subunit delta